MNIFDAFRLQAQFQPTAPAICAPGRPIGLVSYGRLEALSNSAARHALAQGIKRGDVVGWTVGGGIEHMFARNWTAKIEALYADFGKGDGFLTGFSSTYRTQFEHQVVTVRGGLNYKW